MIKGIVANPNLAPHIKESVLAYYSAKMLQYFYTGFYYHTEHKLLTTLSKLHPYFSRELSRRDFSNLPIDYIISKPIPELQRVLSARFLSAKTTHKIWEKNELQFDKWVSKHINKEIDFIHVYEHAALASLIKAKELGILSIYEQSSIHYTYFNQILNQQIQQYPFLKNHLAAYQTETTEQSWNVRKSKELALADYILCNSNFTKRSLIEAQIPAHKIITIPLGFPSIQAQIRNKDFSQKLIFIYAGNLTIGKGIHLLLNAWQNQIHNHSSMELWLVGKNNLPVEFQTHSFDNIKYFGNITQSSLFELYHKAHVYIHPTLADGFGMVIAEAMSHALPIIATENCIAPDILEHMVDGIIIPSNDIQAIENSIIYCLANRDHLQKMATNAFKKSKQHTWEKYRETLELTVKNLVNA